MNQSNIKNNIHNETNSVKINHVYQQTINTNDGILQNSFHLDVKPILDEINQQQQTSNDSCALIV
jgi:hypothetical protein